MGLSLERRFECYWGGIVGVLAHLCREQPACRTIKGLMLPGQHKRIASMAARAQPDNPRSAHQCMRHRVGDALWSDEAALLAVLPIMAERVMHQRINGDEVAHWIVDDTGFPKQGKHSAFGELSGSAELTAARAA